MQEPFFASVATTSGLDDDQLTLLSVADAGSTVAASVKLEPGVTSSWVRVRLTPVTATLSESLENCWLDVQVHPMKATAVRDARKVMYFI